MSQVTRPSGSPPPGSRSETSTLSATSTYDDQGLIFSLILGGAIIAFYVPLVCYLMSTSRLWLKRLYRPNHTVEPPPRESSPSLSPRAAAAEAAFPIHEATDVTAVPAPAGRRRRKRLGISLPYRSSMFHLPSWRDWTSVEERVPHLEGALSTYHATHATPAPRFVGGRTYVPLSSTRPGGKGQAATAAGDVAAATSTDAAPASSAASPGQAQDAAPVSASSTPTPTTPLSPAPAHNLQGLRRQYGSTDAVNRQGPSAPTSPPPAASSPTADVANELPKTPLDPQVALYIFTLKFFASLMILGECFTIWISVVASQDSYNEFKMVKADVKRCHRQAANETACLLKRPYCQYLGEEVGCVPVALPGLYDLTVTNITPRSWRWWPVVLLNAGFCVVLVLLTVFYISRVSRYVRDVMLFQMKHALGYRVACIRGIDSDGAKSVAAFSANYLQERAYFLPRRGERRREGRATQAGGGSPSSPSSSPADQPHAISSIEDEFDYYEQMDCNGFDCIFGIVGWHYYTTYRSDAIFTRDGKVKQILFTRKPPPGIYRAIARAESAMADMQNAVAEEKAVKRKLRRRQLHAIAAAQWQQLSERRGRGGTAGTIARSTSVLVTPPDSDSQRDLPRPAGADNASLPSSGAPPLPAMSSSGSASSTAPASASVSRPAPAAAGPRSRMYTDHSVLNAEDNVDDLVLYTRGCTWASCCQDVPAIPYYEERLRAAAVELNVLLAQVPQQPADSATFVIFADARAAFEFINLFRAKYGGCLSNAVAHMAGPPGQIISSNVLTNKVVLGFRYLLVFVAFVVLLFTYSIPIGLLGSLENLSFIPGVGQSFSESYVETVPSWLRNIINAYLPVVALSLFYVFLPIIVRGLVIAMGAFNKSECDAGHLYMQYIFVVLTAVIFQAALQGGFAQLAFLVSAGEGRYITEFFVACVTPSKVGYFYAKVLMALSFSAWNDLVDPVGVLKAILLRGHANVQRNYDALFMPCEMEYPLRYSFDLMVLAIGLLFHMTIPLLGLFVGVYFILRYITQRARLYDRYRPTLSPAQDCTNFTVSAQVLRCVVWLFVLAETGGVLLLSLRKHTGGVVVCSLTLAIGMLLLVYVHLQTRKWMATLGRAREFSRELAEEHQRQQQQQQPRASPTSASQKRRESSGSAATGVATSAPGSFSSVPPAAEGAVSSTDAEGTRPDVNDDGALMDSYENVRFHLFDDSHSNPFIGHLLPRIPDVSCRYQPKHQRLAPLDVDAEVNKMKRSVFVVERLWDEGVTDAEADMGEQRRARGTGGSPDRRPTRPDSIVVEPVDERNSPRGAPCPERRAATGEYVELDELENESMASPLQRRQQLEHEMLRDSLVVPPRPAAESLPQ